MIESAVAYIQIIIVAHGAFGVLVATLIEEIVAPIPSALVPLASGFFLLPATSGFGAVLPSALLMVAVPVACGVLLGSTVVYWIAYWGGKPVIDRWGKLLGTSWEEIQTIEAKVTKGSRDEITLFILRLIPVIPGVALSGFCGAVRYPFVRFFVITGVGSFLRATALALLGWQAGELYTRYVDTLDRVEHVGLVIVAAAVMIALAVYVYRRNR